MTRRWLALLLAGLVLLLPAGAAAQEAEEEDGDVLVRVNGPLRVERGDSVGTVVVVSDTLTMDGTVRDALVVVDGTATVTGTVEGDVTVVNGTLDLQDGARVTGDVFLANSELRQAAGASVEGDIQRRGELAFRWAWAVFSLLFWVGMTVAVLVAGLLFAAVGGRQLSTAAALLTDRLGPTLLTMLIVWIGIPILAVAVLFTVVGIPLGLGLLLFLLPILWFLGYLVAGTRLGAAVTRAFGRSRLPEHPYLAAVVGLLILQLVALIPVLGGLVAFLAGLVGSGALVFFAARAWRRPAAPPAAPGA